jgi:hypothetical protein
VLAGVPAGEPLARLVEGVAAPDIPSRVGMAEVAAVQDATRLYTAMDLQYGGAVAADVARGALRWSVGLLDASMSGKTKAALSAAVGALADRTAWAHHDAGRSVSAWRLSAVALRAAGEGDDPTLRAPVLLNTASQVGDKHPAEATTILDEALSDSRVCTAEQANLHAVYAKHLSQSGNLGEARHHISLAESFAAREGEVPQWASFLTPAHLDCVITHALKAAGESREACERFERVLPLYGIDRLRGRVDLMITLAGMYAELDRVEEARDLAGRADAAITEVRSVRTASSLANLKRVLDNA